MAGSNAIAKGAVILTANADEMASGLNKAEQKINEFGKRANKATGPGGAGGGMLGGLLGKGGMYVAGAVAGIATVGNAMETLAEKTKLLQVADAFQVDPQKFSGIAGLAKSTGEDIREFTESLVTMGKVAAEGAAGKGEVATKFFQDLKLDAKEFVKLPVDEQFMKVFESINKVQDPLARVRNLMVAFGEDGGKYLLPLLSKTPDELRNMAKGFEENAEKMRQMAAAQKAIGAAKGAGDKAWTGLVAALSPAIEKAAAFAEKLITKARPALEWIGNYIEAKVSIWAIQFEVVADVISEVADFVRGLGNDLEQSLGVKIPTIKEVVVGEFRMIGVAGAYLWDGLKAGAGGVAISFSFVVDGLGVVVDTFKDSIKSVMSATADMLESVDMGEWAGKVRGAIGDVDGLSEKIHDSADSMRKWGGSVIENFGKSADQFNTWLDGKLKKTEEAQKKIGGAAGDTPTSPPISKWAAAVEKGSKEAYSLNLKNMYGMQNNGDDPQTKQLKRNGQLQAETNKNLAGIQKQLAAIGTF